MVPVAGRVGVEGEEIEAQMQYFAEEVAPGLRSACGGSPKRDAGAVPRFDDIQGR